MLCANIAYGDTMNINWIVDGTTYDTTTCTVGGDVSLPTAPTKYGYTFRGWINYTPIEYIQTTGAQNINPGIVVGDNVIKVSVDLQLIQTSVSDTKPVFACGTDGGTNGGMATIGLYGSQWNMLLPGTSYNNFVNATTNRIQFDFTINNGSASVTGDLNKTSTSSNYAYGAAWRSKNCYIFGIIQYKLYSMKIYMNNTLIRDYVPALDYNDVPCLYDKVNNQFYYNTGSGANFTAGNPI